MKKCDWASFQRRLSEDLKSFNASEGSLDGAVKKFSGVLLAAFRAAAPLGARNDPKAWWTDDCSETL